MSMTDPLGDMLTRIRNGQQAKKDSILTPASKLRARVLDVLQREGYIRGYSEADAGTATAAVSTAARVRRSTGFRADMRGSRSRSTV
jgi:small subunit ribosomal protein S8